MKKTLEGSMECWGSGENMEKSWRKVGYRGYVLFSIECVMCRILGLMFMVLH